jgi:hypothetical protein
MVGARERAMAAASASIDAGRNVELQRSGLRGRRPVRADHRLRTDEKHVRAQSAILYKSNPTPYLFLNTTAFPGRMAFIRAENTVRARSAQWTMAIFKSQYTTTL